MSKIILKTPKEVIVRESKTITEIEILASHDDKINKVAKAFVMFEDEEAPRCLELWKNEAWDAIGQYTDSQIEERVLEIIAQMI